MRAYMGATSSIAFLRRHAHRFFEHLQSRLVADFLPGNALQYLQAHTVIRVLDSKKDSETKGLQHTAIPA